MSLYDTDYFAWTRRTANALRNGPVESIDLNEVAEEIEDLGKSERRALESALAQLLLHLLKWDFQAECRSAGGQASIRKQRRQIRRITEQNPSLRPCLREKDFVSEAYQDALDDAVIETGIGRENFPADCPYGIGQILD